MGYYTTVYPVKFKNQNIDVQFYTGNDIYEEYKLGDTVNWYIDKDYYMEGRLLDGVYQGIGGYKNKEGEEVYHYFYVVISNHKIVEVVPTKNRKEYDNEQEKFLRKKWKIRRWKKEWWTKEAYQKELEFRKKQRKEWNEWKKKVRWNERTPEEQMRLSNMRVLSRKLDYVGLVKKFVTVETWPEGKPVIFDK